MRLRNKKMYPSTPTVGEEQLQFRLIMPVVESVQPRTPGPGVNRPQSIVSLPSRLPNPMPTFTISAPPNQGHRAFFRALNIFQPSSGIYIIPRNIDAHDSRKSAGYGVCADDDESGALNASHSTLHISGKHIPAGEYDLT